MQLLGLSDGGGIQALPQCHKSSLIWSVEAQTSCSRGLALGRGDSAPETLLLLKLEPASCVACRIKAR